MSTETVFLNTLRQHRQSITASRRAVFEALTGSEPLTMAELVSRVAGVDRASVYRTVSLFEKIGIIQRLQSGWKYKLELTDAYHEDHHHHATCMVCSSSFVLAEDLLIEKQLRKLASFINFRLERHQLELQGYCQSCRELLSE